MVCLIAKSMQVQEYIWIQTLHSLHMLLGSYLSQGGLYALVFDPLIVQSILFLIPVSPRILVNLMLFKWCFRITANLAETLPNLQSLSKALSRDTFIRNVYQIVYVLCRTNIYFYILLSIHLNDNNGICTIWVYFCCALTFQSSNMVATGFKVSSIAVYSSTGFFQTNLQ